MSLMLLSCCVCLKLSERAWFDELYSTLTMCQALPDITLCVLLLPLLPVCNRSTMNPGEP